MPAYDLILCIADKSVFADALTQQLRGRRVLRFDTEIAFARWLFEQPRNATMLATMLVVGLREAKPCMDAISAVRTGDISLLRPDQRRPQLSQAAPGVEISAAVAEMAVVVQTKSAEKRAVKWAERKGSLDPNVRTLIVKDAEQLVGMVAAALPAKAAALPAQVAAAPARKLWADVIIMEHDDDKEWWSELLKDFSSQEENFRWWLIAVLMSVIIPSSLAVELKLIETLKSVIVSVIFWL